MKYIYTLFGIFLLKLCVAQTPINISVTSTEADKVLKGLYNPLSYVNSTVPSSHSTIAQGVNANISADSLKSLIIKLASFKNRNSGSDTVSATEGIGAARRWVFEKFQSYAAQEGNNRLLPAYLQFNQDICAVNQHKNIFSVLPGTDTTDKSILIIEGHIDSRCEDVCDIGCLAEGVEDNASGTALVMELARVMSKYKYKQTIVFLIVIAEEQGLFGANAFATYTEDNSIPIRAVLNNDVIGGIICGRTSSNPRCPGLNDIDSTQVRLFSAGTADSPHKNFARYTKLQYKEELLPFVSVPMLVSIMSAEDRSGRGGDHIPFREKGYTAIRFTSANEHGNASPTATYTDRQHSTRDGLGVDTDGDMVVDSFFVDFNYLARNAAINGASAGMAAIAPPTPAYTINGGSKSFTINFTNSTYRKFRIALRSTTNDWDTLFTLNDTLGTINVNATGNYYLSAAAMSEENVESLFGAESFVNLSGINDLKTAQDYGITLLQNKPNPFDEATTISFMLADGEDIKSLKVQINDLQGRLIKEYKLNPKTGVNELLYEHGYGASGTYVYSIVLNNKVIASKQMIFAN